MLTKTLPSNTALDTFEGAGIAGVLIHLMSSALFSDCISTFFCRAGGLFKVSWLKKLKNVSSSHLSEDVCVCVCIYALPPVGFFRLHDICDIREKFGSTIFCCEHFLGASAKFLHLYLRIYLISPPKTKTPTVLLQERKRCEIIRSTKRWYILI